MRPVQNLAGAIMSLFKMGCLQHLSSFGEIQQKMLRGKFKGEKNVLKKYIFLPFGISTQLKHLHSLRIFCKNMYVHSKNTSLTKQIICVISTLKHQSFLAVVLSV